ncbi:hypothetical protein GmHk_16G047164 [Glycine max]|nr:hypothetical protein GmHk_16G047164 [Glycine max]
MDFIRFLLIGNLLYVPLKEMKIRYIILWKRVQKLKIKYANLTANIARLRRECMDSDERIKGLRKIVEALRKEAQFKDEVSKVQREELKRLRARNGRYGRRSSL